MPGPRRYPYPLRGRATWLLIGRIWSQPRRSRSGPPGTRAGDERPQRAVDDRVGPLAPQVPHVAGDPKAHVNGLGCAERLAREVRDLSPLAGTLPAGAGPLATPGAEVERLLSHVWMFAFGSDNQNALRGCDHIRRIKREGERRRACFDGLISSGGGNGSREGTRSPDLRRHPVPCREAVLRGRALDPPPSRPREDLDGTRGRLVHRGERSHGAERRGDRLAGKEGHSRP